MVSTLDAAKRVLVVLLRTLAATYNCAVGVTRDSSDAVIRKAYRTMSLKTHPDKGGAEEDQQNLNNASPNMLSPGSQRATADGQGGSPSST